MLRPEILADLFVSFALLIELVGFVGFESVPGSAP